MAAVSSASSSHRKRSHKSSHRRDRHSETKRNKTSVSTKPESHSKPLNKSKTLIQLAKMVQNGKLAIPTSLVEYIDDHTSLIDQIFTILTIDDIEGMLPDILKGLKLKKIKQLCNTQLDTITAEDLQQIMTQDVPERPASSNPSHTHETLVINNISDDEMESTSSNMGVVNEDQIQVNVGKEEMLIYSNGEDQNSNRGKEREEEMDEDCCQDKVVSTTTLVNKDNNYRKDDTLITALEDSQLLEMKLREKLLEAQVRRLTEKEEQRRREEEQRKMKEEQRVNSSDETVGELEEQCSESIDTGKSIDPGKSIEPGKLIEPREPIDPGELIEPGEPIDPGEPVDPGELIELDLRQKALESLLAKRREKLINKCC